MLSVAGAEYSVQAGCYGLRGGLVVGIGVQEVRRVLACGANQVQIIEVCKWRFRWALPRVQTGLDAAAFACRVGLS